MDKQIEMNESVNRKSGRDMYTAKFTRFAPLRISVRTEKKNLKLFGMTFSFVRFAAPASVCFSNSYN